MQDAPALAIQLLDSSIAIIEKVTFKKESNIKPNFIEAQKKLEGAKKERNNLLDYLTFYNPKKKKLQSGVVNNIIEI